MRLERDYTTERLARIDRLLAEAKRTNAGKAPTDRVLAPELVDKLDEMLKEVRGPYLRAGRWA